MLEKKREYYRICKFFVFLFVCLFVCNGALHSLSTINFLTNQFAHNYQLGMSTFIFRGVRSDFYFIFL